MRTVLRDTGLRLAVLFLVLFDVEGIVGTCGFFVVLWYLAFLELVRVLREGRESHALCGRNLFRARNSSCCQSAFMVSARKGSRVLRAD